MAQYIGWTVWWCTSPADSWQLVFLLQMLVCYAEAEATGGLNSSTTWCWLAKCRKTPGQCSNGDTYTAQPCPSIRIRGSAVQKKLLAWSIWNEPWPSESSVMKGQSEAPSSPWFSHSQIWWGKAVSLGSATSPFPFYNSYFVTLLLKCWQHHSRQGLRHNNRTMEAEETGHEQ